MAGSGDFLLPDDPDPDLAGTGVIGGYWTRNTTVEADLVGIDRWPNARKVTLTGSVSATGHFLPPCCRYAGTAGGVSLARQRPAISPPLSIPRNGGLRCVARLAACRGAP
jgi:hypothetical protein